MKEVSKQNFGLVIAYLLPGLVALWGVSYFSETVRLWLTTGQQSAPTVAGFLYVTIAALTAGLTLSAVRVVTVDLLHHCTGVPKPEWDFSEFQAKFWAFNQLVESHFCHYQFYAHMCLALPWLVAAHWFASGEKMQWWLMASCVILELVLLVVSRGTLKTYYTRTSHLLSTEKDTSSFGVRKSDGKHSQNRRGKQAEVTLHTPAEEKPAEKLGDRPEPGKPARW